MTNPKVGAVLLSFVTLIYLFLMTNQAITLIQIDDWVAKTMGVVLFGLPAVGFWAIFRELKFGLQTEKLAKIVRAEGRWPLFELELRPSGRPIRESAQKVFDDYSDLAQKQPEDWHSWFNLSLAYDAAGDGRRARESMRKAIEIANKK